MNPFDMLKYLPLMQVASNHPNLVTMVNQILDLIKPHIPEIEQALLEAEAIIQRIDPPQTQGASK